MKIANHIIAGCIALLPTSMVLAQSDQAVEFYEQGLAQNQVYKLVGASVSFTEAIGLYPEYAQAYYQRGLSFAGMGKQDHAIKDFNAAVGYKITELDPYLRLIAWHKERHQYLAALLITDQLIANMPENAAGGYYDKGQIYELMGNSTLAVVAYKACLQRLEDEASDFANMLKHRISELQK
ncbi:MAG: hypothetical protein V3V13_00085 [Paracoccaceae bacterium]